MYKRVRTWVGLGWILICIIALVASGEAWAWVLMGLMVVTFFLLGFERLVKMVLGKGR